MAGRALALDSHSLRQLLDELDAETSPVGVGDEAAAERQYPYRARALRMDVRRHDGVVVQHVVQARSISSRSMSVLAPCGLYPPTLCEVYAIDTEGAWQVVPARIAACQQLERHPDIWDIRLVLLQSVDVARYAASAWRANILVVDDSPTICRVMTRFLPDYHADATCVQDGHSALEAALRGTFDLIILDVEMPGINGIEVARTLRERGYINPIVIMTATSAQENRFACMDAGCDSWVSKPIKAEELAELIRMVKPPPLVSALADDPESTELIDLYVESLRTAARELGAAYREDDRETLARITHQICAEAPSCGFPSIAKLAARVEDAVKNGFPRGDIRRPLCELLQNIRAARPASRFEPPEPAAPIPECTSA